MVSMAFAVDIVNINIVPDRIITNSEVGVTDTIRVSIPISLENVEGPEVTEFSATISFVGGGSVDAVSCRYIPITDILHIYFNEVAVMDALEDLEGTVTADLECSFVNGTTTYELEGSDDIEVIRPNMPDPDPDPEQPGPGPGNMN